MTGDDYSLTALGEFLDFAADKGLIKRNTAASRKQAANKILGILDQENQNDLRSVDPDEVFNRFTNLRGNKFTPSSLRVYHSRMRSALADFLEYKKDPAHFKPTSGARMVRTKPASSKKSTARQGETSTSDSSAGDTEPNQVSIPIPIRQGLLVEIRNLPSDLTEAEASKIAAIVQAYAAPRDAQKKGGQ